MKQISWYLVIIMFLLGIAPKVDAGLAPSELLYITNYDRTADLEKIQKSLELKAVSERLKQFGLTRDEIQSRLSMLSDHQIHQIALQLDNLKIGQDDALGVIIAILIITILIVILLKLTGHRVIVTR